ncbi:MAG: helix-turn-helix domain-containing protein [Erysipelotrichaceae bacterium]|nr:helix-turn-helix domain-containing protein [Erysipelotrichaceae bacterium]
MIHLSQAVKGVERLTIKEKIIYKALCLFATRGYGLVSVRDISRAVGIKESSLYNHFANKQDIFDTIVCVCEQRALESNVALSMQDTLNGDYKPYEGIAMEQLLLVTTSLFKFYVEDDYMSKFRQMLMIEQFNSEQMGELYRKLFIDAAIEHQTQLFKYLMNQGWLKVADPSAVALDFYGPVFMLMNKYREYNAEVAMWLMKHIQNFVSKNSN